MQVSKLGLGTVQFGLLYGISNELGQTMPEEVTEILNYARNVGIDTLDTASAYGDSERVLGQNSLNDFRVVSKFLLTEHCWSIEAMLQQSLELLNIKRLHGYLAHRPMDVVRNPDQWKELIKLKESGKVCKIGFSFNSPDEVDEVLKSGMMPDLIQVPYNYFDRRFIKCMTELKMKGCEIHTRSAFLQGLFLKPAEQLDEFFDVVRQQIAALQNNYGDLLPGLLLKYCLKSEAIDKVIVGVNTKQQMIDNLRNISIADELPECEIEIPQEIVTPSKWLQKTKK